MRIIYDAYGQMCNRLWEYLDQVAWAKINNNKVVAFFWDPSLEDFDILRHNPHISFPFYFRTNLKRLERIYKFVLLHVLNNRFMLMLFKSSVFRRMGFVSGKELLFKHEYYPSVWKDIKYFFSPNEIIAKRMDSDFTELRKKYSCAIVGVHIRRGDYKYYGNGQFFYSNSEYKNFMDQVRRLLGQETLFFLASNESIYKEDFSDFNIANLNNSKPVEDMYSLSKCDYIIGPYSSFSAWASFYGEVPYCMLERRKEISLSDFSVVDSFNRPSIS